MIKVEHLTKIFKSRKKVEVKALDDISFNLPDTGLVFVVGKSGSGKTTLLSLIGTLNNATSGDIFYNDLNITKLKEKDASYFRNEILGFIYQDYHLLEELTIKENLELVLKIKKLNETNIIDEILKKVGLENYQNRYPKELSGGEKQRVAIARALIKNPKIILADEPTGNLDENTSIQIFDLLKEVAKDKLVLIVSHDLDNAYKYADNIIELKEGKIINSLIRNNEFEDKVTFKNDILNIPENRILTEKEKSFVNKYLPYSKKIIWHNDVFKQNNVQNKHKTLKNEPLKHNHLSFKESLFYGFKFLKSKVIFAIFTSIIIGLLTTILTLSQLIMNFDSSKVFSDGLNNWDQNTIVLKQEKMKDDQILCTNKPFNIPDSTINELKSSGYKGNIYSYYDLGYLNRFGLNLSNIYQRFDKGVLVCDEPYLVKEFGKNEELEFIEKVDDKDFKDFGIYITDFKADSFLLDDTNTCKTYKDCLGYDKYEGNYKHYYVNGIINTHYKERYSDALMFISNINKKSESEINKFKDSKIFQEFADEYIQYLTCHYSFNQNFREDFIQSECRNFLYNDEQYISFNGNKLKLPKMLLSSNVKQVFNVELNAGEAALSIEKYNELTNSNLPVKDEHIKLDEPFEIEYVAYNDDKDVKNEVIFTKKFKITYLLAKNYVDFMPNTEDFKLIQDKYFERSMIYLDDFSNSNEVLEKASDLNMRPISLLAESLITVTKAVNVFSSFFNIIYYVLISAIILFLVVNAFKIIKDEKYNIGVLKSLGVRNYDFVTMFGLNLGFISVTSLLTYIVSTLLFTNLSNDILIKSIRHFAPTNILLDIDLLINNPVLISLNCLLIVAIGTIVFLLSLIKLNNIKPIDIIKAKE